MKTERNLISFFYVGRNDNTGKNIMPKIGQTKQILKNREREIRKEYKHYKMLGCLILINATKAEREHIESEVRYHMEKYGKNIKNDHFLVKAKAKKYQEAQYKAFALIALGYAIDCCEREKFPYVFKFF